MKNLYCALLFSTLTLAATAKNEPYQDSAPDNSIVIDRITNDDVEVLMPSVIFKFSDVQVKLRFRDSHHTRLLLNQNKIEFLINGEPKLLSFENGEASFNHKFDNENDISIYAEEFSFRTTVTAYPLWAILLPALIAIAWLISRIQKKNKA
jgi:hypothetical protein